MVRNMYFYICIYFYIKQDWKYKICIDYVLVPSLQLYKWIINCAIHLKLKKITLINNAYVFDR